MKKDTYYFSHDSNAMSDPKILAMRCDYGLEGYGLYWVIIEMLRNESNYKLSLNKTTYRAIKVQTGTSIDIEEFINNCINEYVDSSTGNGLFNSDGNMFWSASLLKRMEKYEELKEKRSQAGKKAMENRWRKNDKKINSSKRKISKYKKINKKITFVNKSYNNAITNVIKMHSNDITKNNKLNEIKLNKSKLNINNKLNKTKLNLLFNYINGTEKVFESLSEADRQSILTTLRRLELEVPQKAMNYLSEKQILYSKIHYWIIKEIYLSPYKTYLNSLNKEKFIFKFLLAEKYINIDNIDNPTEEKIEQFIKYFMICLREEMIKENKRCIKA